MKYSAPLEELARLVPQDPAKRPGHLNYLITSLLRKVFQSGMRYADHNEVLGVLSAVELEFYRRSIAPYEDEKIESEGDLE